MLKLREVPLFSELSDEDFQVVSACAKAVDFDAGSYLCRRGDQGSRLYIIVSGAVAIETAPGRSFVRGPGQIIGELSLLSGNPVSASVRVLRPARAYAIDKDAFLRLLETSRILHRSLSELLVERVIKQPGGAGQSIGACVLIVAEGKAENALARRLFQSMRSQASQSYYCEFSGLSDGASVQEETAGAPSFDCPASAWKPLAGDGEFVLDPSRCSPAAALQRWRDTGEGALVLAVPRTYLQSLKSLLWEGDAVVLLQQEGAPNLLGCEVQASWGVADLLPVYLGAGRLSTFGEKDRCWGVRLDASWQGEKPSQHNRRELGLVVRWVLRRSVGVALGAGAARGLAHLGVLDVLEREEVPIDALSGTSIGGIVSLAYGKTGSAQGAIDVMREYMSRKDLVLDRFKTYFSAYYPGKKIKRSAQLAFEDLNVEQLLRPVSVVAADMVTGDKIVLNRGHAGNALLATSAIPGIFPPVERDGRLLFDGASVSRVPVDLLDSHRCALKIAVNVAPQPRYDEASMQQARRSVFRFMGFRDVWMRNWEVQAYWDGVKETTHADILMEPDTAEFSMFDFDRFDELLDLGRKVAEDSLPAIRAAMSLSVEGA